MNVYILTVIILGTLLTGIYVFCKKDNKFSGKLSQINEYYSTEEFSVLLGRDLIVFSFSCVPAWIASVFEIDWLLIPAAILILLCFIGCFVFEALYRRRKKGEK